MAPLFHPAKPLNPAAMVSVAGAILLALGWPAPAAGQEQVAQPAPSATARTPDPVAPRHCSVRPVLFGCANAANLMETASPADLAVGRPLSAADGEIEAAAIGRLKADKVKDLRREGTDSAGGAPQ